MRVPSLVALLTLLAACGKQPAAPLTIQRRVTLARAASCDSLTRAVQDTATREMRSQMESQKGVAYAAGGPLAPAPASGSAPASYSTTNTQVAGVDEADFVKNDGTRIFVLSGRTLFTATSWPPQSLALAGKLQIEGWPGTMFLEGNQVVIFSSIWKTPSADPMGLPCPSMGCGTLATTKITVVDVSDLSAPTARAEVFLPGDSAGARRVGSRVRLVLNDGVRWPKGIQWWPTYDPAIYSDPKLLALAFEAVEDRNEAIIRATPLSSWFPDGKRTLADGRRVDVGYTCSDFYLSNAPEHLGLITIATLDLADLAGGVSRASIVAQGGTLYANAERLYVASAHWWWTQAPGQLTWTYLHAFDISQPSNAAYIGSGGVEGAVGDQFSMDEQDGYLRVATSTTKYVADPARPSQLRFEIGSRLSVLAPQPDSEGNTKLALVGEVPSLMDGERLMATRFVGDRGYAVTFRNVDPFITLDLTDPAHPKKVAELTIPGFSTYLEPIDADHLLTIGVDLPVDANGRVDRSRRALQLSIFDVSDLSHPVRTAQTLVGTASAYSEALWDHHAFNWYRPDPGKPGLLAIPFSDWQAAQSGGNWWDSFVSDVRLFSVDAASGVAPLGSLGMADVYVKYGSGDWTWWYRPWVRRSVLATDQAGNTFVYAVSDAGVRTAALSRLDAPLATVLFPSIAP